MIPIFAILFALASTGPNLPADEALQRLQEGNSRFYQGEAIRPRQDAKRRSAVAANQSPFVIVLGCSDSRVPPEIIFDEGLGDIFDVRVAGNVADAVTIGSMEYSVETQGVQLIVVLGHERCGAVKAALMNTKVGGDLAVVIDQIKQNIAPVKDMGGNALSNAIRANVQYGVKSLPQSSPVFAKQMEEGQLMIVGAIYDLETGIVEFLL